MQKSLSACFVIAWLGVLLVATTVSAGTPARFIQYPDIHNNTIVFTWDRDLWSVPATGGEARRLTTHPGMENFARFSPDGKSIAFTGQYEGADVYVMDVGGGAPKRVTFLATGARPVAWTPDGSKIIFRSGHENTFRPIVKLFAASPAGSLPEQLPMDRGILASYSPDGS